MRANGETSSATTVRTSARPSAPRSTFVTPPPRISAGRRSREVPVSPPVGIPLLFTASAGIPAVPATPAMPATPATPATPTAPSRSAPAVPLTRREARALREGRLVPAETALHTPTTGELQLLVEGPAGAPDTKPLVGPLPRSRAERRRADREAARSANAGGRSARGQRAALTVALVGLGVALVHKGSTDELTSTASLAQGPATPATGLPLTELTPAAYLGATELYEIQQAKAGSHHRTPRATTQTSAAASPSTGSPSAAARAQVAGVAVKRLYGTPRSGLPWLSGWWAGGPQNNGDGINAAGSWRGASMDMATAYPSYATWDDMKETNVGLFAGFGGRLAYGLPLLPQDRRGQWDDVTSGAHDDVFRAIARDLVANGFADSAVRVGLEANGDWFAWGANASNADQFKAAFRHVVQVMRAEAPKLTFWFDTSASANPLPGTSGRADMLSILYPGDDVVDGISMDHYDFYSLVAHTDAEFANAMRPPNGTGLQDAVDFARQHGKGFAVPEWGIHDTQGAGDNPFFIKKMFEFFQANKDVLVFEDYFNEPESYIGNALMGGQNPQSAAMYQKLWGGK